MIFDGFRFKQFIFFNCRLFFSLSIQKENYCFFNIFRNSSQLFKSFFDLRAVWFFLLLRRFFLFINDTLAVMMKLGNILITSKKKSTFVAKISNIYSTLSHHDTIILSFTNDFSNFRLLKIHLDDSWELINTITSPKASILLHKIQLQILLNSRSRPCMMKTRRNIFQKKYFILCRHLRTQ